MHRPGFINSDAFDAKKTAAGTFFGPREQKKAPPTVGDAFFNIRMAYRI
jgi:hypothetical protein